MKFNQIKIGGCFLSPTSKGRILYKIDETKYSPVYDITGNYFIHLSKPANSYLIKNLNLTPISIKLEIEAEKTTFGDLEVGDSFMHSDCVYEKIPAFTLKSNPKKRFNAVDTECDELLAEFKDKDEVERA